VRWGVKDMGEKKKRRETSGSARIGSHQKKNWEGKPVSLGRWDYTGGERKERRDLAYSIRKLGGEHKSRASSSSEAWTPL